LVLEQSQNQIGVFRFSGCKFYARLRQAKAFRGFLKSVFTECLIMLMELL
jgi:hypothetical protein